MITMIKSNKIETPKHIENRYPHCKYILTDFQDVNHMQGHLYAISSGKDSFNELCVLSDKLTDEGIVCIIMGEYEERGMIGVQREFHIQ